VALGLLFLRLPSILHPFNIDDEGLYSVVAIEHMHGARLYADVVDRKPPLLYAAYQAVFSLAGVNMIAIHVASALWTLLTMAGLALTAHRLFGKTAALMAAILYGIYTGFGPYTNLAWNGELLTNLPIVWALVVVFWRGNSRLRPGLLAAGAFLGVAFLLKQPGATSALALGLYLLLPSYRRSRGLSILHSFLHAGFLSVGFAVVLAGMLLHLRAEGALSDALY
jgi:4-amino-4-deoxy-L-arabinose transferase-like glycosyltransferase